MSAAEKLKALEADARRMSAGHGHAFVPHSLIDALPQIVAVVEAAELITWDAEDKIGKHYGLHLHAALAALDQVLGDD